MDKTEAPELNLLLATACAQPDVATDLKIRKILKRSVDWTCFAQAALTHGIACLAGSALARSAPNLVPDDILDAFRSLIEQTRRENFAHFEELVRLHEIFSAAGIPAIPFKDISVALRGYNDPGLRPVRDIDFLVHLNDVPHAKDLLGQSGYFPLEAQKTPTSREHVPPLYRHGYDVPVRVHDSLTRKAALPDVEENIWQRTRPIRYGTRCVPSLAPEDEVLSLTFHGSQGFWASISWASDLAHLLVANPQIEWHTLLAHARMQGCGRMALLGMSLARTYLGAPVPNELAEIGEKDPLIKSYVQRIVASWTSPPSINSKNSFTLIDALRLYERPLDKIHHTIQILVNSFNAASKAYAAARTDLNLSQLRRVVKVAIPLTFLPVSLEARKEISRYRALKAEVRRLLAINSNDLLAWLRLGDALSGLRAHSEAVECFEQALQIEPDAPAIWRRWRQAMDALGVKRHFPPLAENPLTAIAWAVRAGAFLDTSRLGEVIEATEAALGMDRKNNPAIRMGIHARLHSCDWSMIKNDRKCISEAIAAGTVLFKTLDHRSLCNSEQELRQAANFLVPKAAFRPLWNGQRYHHDKVRIAYVSSDLRLHAVASLIVGVIEHHDKTRFETIAISLQAGDGSDLRNRLEAAFDRFIDARAINDQSIAEVMRDLEVDIAIDLNGYSGSIRQGVFPRRPAPLQVNYLGYPGTTGAPYIDYILADQFVIPEENRGHYSEEVVYLPHTYLPTDRAQQIARRTPTRREAQLPETGFVFACLNHNYKIGPEVFAVWMRLLKAVEGSVLWLRSTNVAAVGNLRRAAKAQGVSSDRILFAPPVLSTADHLARLRLADLFMDTVPYNAHATAIDALWAGLPLLTCMGNTFSGRVAGGALHAIELPELVTTSLPEYEAVALDLARNPERLALLRAKLLHNRLTTPLFDTARYTRSIETAYTMMLERLWKGLAPASFSVPK